MSQASVDLSCIYVKMEKEYHKKPVKEQNHEMHRIGGRKGRPFVAPVQKELSETVYKITEKPFNVPGDHKQEPPFLR